MRPDQLPVAEIGELPEVALRSDGGLEELNALLRTAQHHVSAAFAEDYEGLLGRDVIPSLGCVTDELDVGVADAEMIV